MAEAAAVRPTELQAGTSRRSPSPAAEDTSLWVFGYGSLCWHQGFEFDRTMTGFVRGYARRFWQGNTTHRGTEHKPGRVATLVEDDEGLVWGQAFQVTGDDALPYLNNRECELGGYLTTISTFYPRQPHGGSPAKPFPVVLYLATPSNRHWLGESPLPEIANQIVECSGGSGHNVEYLLRLADFVRDTIPEAVDDHLFTLELLVLAGVKERRLCLKALMGGAATVRPGQQPEQPDHGAGARAAPAGTAQFSARVPSKELRCVNI